MRLFRLEVNGEARWGRAESGSDLITLYSGQLREGLSSFSEDAEQISLAEAQLLAPAEPSKIVCVGRNYTEHIRELGNAGPKGEDLPTEPGIFLKGPNALIASGEAVPYPSWSSDFQFEGELAAVIGQRCKALKPEEALSAVLGYTCALDLTARDVQRSDLQWFRAKAADRFCPLGPWLVPALSPFDLRVQTRINGEVRQDGRTSQMIFDLVQILVYVTRYVTLEPGDVVLTGTPQGVGQLQPGDCAEVEIEGIGTLQTRITAG